MEEDIVEVPNQNLIEYLKFYLSIDNPQFAVLVNGKWGSGKTFFIKKQLEHWKAKPSKEDENNILLKPIYISLYGVANLNEISEKIKEQLNPFLHSKTVKFLKKITLGAIKVATHVSLDTDENGKEDSKVSFDINSLGLLKSSDPKIKGNKVLIFDDLERCNIKLKVLFGYLNEFVEHYNCKLILLSDEEKINKNTDEADSYKEFKEKLIGQTFALQTDIDNAIISFTSRLATSAEKEFLLNSSSLIKSFFNASKIENLRILKQSILDFVRFTSQFDNTVKQHTEYIKFLYSLLAHFLIVYLEYKSGNHSIADIGYGYLEAEKKIESPIKAKYDNIQDKFLIYSRNNVIEYTSITDFIKNGYSNNDVLNNYIKQTHFFKDTSLIDWQKLWDWKNLEDNEFYEVYNSVLMHFNNSNYTNPYFLLHSAAILISLIEKNVTAGDKSQIIESFKIQFESILDNSINEMYSPIDNDSYGKSYMGQKTTEIKELIIHTNERISLHNLQHREEYLKGIFENLNDENFPFFQYKIDKSMPDHSAKYSLESIFAKINGYKLGDNLLKLKNKNLRYFFFFLKSRYYLNGSYYIGYNSCNIQDKECLSNIAQRFEAKLQQLTPRKQLNLTEHIEFLSNLIEEMSKSEEIETTETVTID